MASPWPRGPSESTAFSPVRRAPQGRPARRSGGGHPAVGAGREPIGVSGCNSPSRRSGRAGDARRAGRARVIRLTCGPDLRYPPFRLVNRDAAGGGVGSTGERAAPKSKFLTSNFGFYCLEAAVMAAALKLRVPAERTHISKQRAARVLASKGHPDISNLLRDLNEARKSRAYGDVPFPRLDAENVAAAVETFVTAVNALFAEPGI
jgi:hypothetical protein